VNTLAASFNAVTYGTNDRNVSDEKKQVPSEEVIQEVGNMNMLFQTEVLLVKPFHLFCELP